MENYTNKCDFDPTSTRKILPKGITVASMYREFKEKETEDLPCLSYFYFIWKRHMSHCVSVTRKVSQTDENNCKPKSTRSFSFNAITILILNALFPCTKLGMCAVCSHSYRMLKTNMHPNERQRIIALRDQHLERVSTFSQ